MTKRVLTLFLCFAIVFCMVCPSAFAVDSGTVSGCNHDWVVPTDHYYSVPIPGEDLNLGVEVEQCSKCGLYKHTADYLVGKSTYYSLLPPHYNGLIPSELLTYWGNLWFDFFGQNATAEKAPSGIGRKDLPGYADDNGTPTIGTSGYLQLVVYPEIGINSASFYEYPASFSYSSSSMSVLVSGQDITVRRTSSSVTTSSSAYIRYKFVAPVSGLYFIDGSQLYVSGSYDDKNATPNKYYVNQSYLNKVCSAGETYYAPASYFSVPLYAYSTKHTIPATYSVKVYPITISYVPTSTIINKQTNITINNNTWNGNIYTDNSTNLTYIYPEYTTINENNETVTNISSSPIIYNSETDQYYTYDSTTNNYYYITYVTEPPPSPTPDPGTDPTPTPGGGGSGGGSGGSGSGDSGSSGPSWWEKLLDKLGSAIIDGLLGAISAVLKLIFKLFSTILGWVIWLVSQVLTLFPFLPPGLGALLIGGVVVCLIIGIIKFIRG